jgi:rubredoxin
MLKKHLTIGLLLLITLSTIPVKAAWRVGGYYSSPILKPVALLNASLRVMLFTLHEDKQVCLKTQIWPSASFTSWPASYDELGAPAAHTLANDLAAAMNSDFRVYVFSLVDASSSNKRLYYRKETSLHSGTFHPWTRVEYAGGFGGLEAILVEDGLAVFTTSIDGKLQCIKFPPYGSPSAPQIVGSLGSNDTIKKFTVIQKPDGLLEVAATVKSSSTITVRRIYQTSPTAWGSWASIGSPSSPIDVEAEIKSVINWDGDIMVFVNTTDWKIFSRTHYASGGWSPSWTQVGNFQDAYKRFDVGMRGDCLDLIYAKKPYHPDDEYEHAPVLLTSLLPGATAWTPSDRICNSYFVSKKYVDKANQFFFFNNYYAGPQIFVTCNYVYPNPPHPVMDPLMSLSRADYTQVNGWCCGDLLDYPWYCNGFEMGESCMYVYRTELHSGIELHQQPDDWVCPWCGYPKSQFTRKEPACFVGP